MPRDGNVRAAVVNGIAFLKSLPYRNVLIEINNETSVRGYSHPLLQPNGIFELVRLAKEHAGKDFPVSMSWSGGILPRGSNGDLALRLVDYVMFHTNGKTPEQVHTVIQEMRGWTGYERPLLINEDGVSTFNLQAAVDERVGWGYYDQGWNNYRDGFQSPPTNWRINTTLKWLFFEQVARLTGSPVPPQPDYSDNESPQIELIGLKAGDLLSEPAWIEAVVHDRHSRWPIKRVEFFVDDQPFSYSKTAPFMLGNREWWDPRRPDTRRHTLRVAAFDMRGPRFTETCTILEVPFTSPKECRTVKHAIITAFLGKLRDRFCEYQEPLTHRTETGNHGPHSRCLGSGGGLPVRGGAIPKERCGRTWTGSSWKCRRSTSTSRPIRTSFTVRLPRPIPKCGPRRWSSSRAPRTTRAAIGADKVTCCPLSDGYDYSFQTDYGKAWKRMVDTVREAAAYRLEVPLFMEYKPSETRVHCTLDSAAKTLLLCDAVGTGNVGVTIDIGHSIYGGETPPRRWPTYHERPPVLRTHQ